MFRPLIPILTACCVSSTAAAQGLPWKAGDKPPMLAGFTLLENGDSARARLSGDIKVDTLGSGPGAAFAYTNAMAGYSVVISPGDGVAIIYVTKREEGDIDSIRVGDESAAVLRRWGKPTTAGGPNALWVVGDWVVLIELGKGDRVVRIGIGRAA